MLLVLAVAPLTVPGVVAGVVLFRVFDMTKPWPARAARAAARGLGRDDGRRGRGGLGAALVGGARALGLFPASSAARW